MRVPTEHKEEWREFLLERKAHYRIDYETRWERVRKSYGLMNLVLDLLDSVLRGPYCFSCIVVLKRAYRKWSVNEESAFYTTYTLLIEDCARLFRDEAGGQVDEKSDSYGKQREVVEKIADYKLSNSAGGVTGVVRANSQESVEIQAADLLTGAVNAAHARFLDSEYQMHRGKHLLLERFAGTLGWDHCHYDTWPNPNFNIWHFPTEWRATPRTRKVSPTRVARISRTETELL